MQQRNLGESMQCSKTIADRSANAGEGRVGCDQPFLDLSVAAGAAQLGLVNRLKLLVHLSHDCETVQQHGMNNKAVVVIEMKELSVAIKAVALVPTKHAANAAGEPLVDGFLSHEVERGFNRGGEHD